MYRALLIINIIVILGYMSPASARDYISDAEHHIASGDLRTGEIQLKNAVKEDPNNMEARYRLGVLELRLGNPVAAETQAEIAQAKGYDPDRVIPLLAQAYLAQGKYQEILNKFSPTEGGPGRREGVLVARGYAFFALAKRSEALASFIEAQQVKPDAIEPLVGEAKVYIAQGNMAKASAVLDKGEAIDPKSSGLLLAKAQLLKAKGDIPGAIAALDTVVTATPNLVSARLDRAGLLLRQGKDALAKADIDTALKIQPNNALTIYMQAALFAKAKQYREAETDLEKISGVLARIPPAYRLLAIVKYNLRETAEAVDAASRYAARNPDDLDAQKLLARLELETGHPDSAISLLEKFSGTDKTDPEALDLLGRAFALTGNTSRALKAFQEAAGLAPDSAGPQMRMAALQLRSGHSEAAIGDFERALKLAPSSTVPAEALVLTDLAAGHFDNADATAENLIKNRSGNPTAGNLIGLVKLTKMDLAGADKTFTAVVSAHPGFVPAQLNLARVAELQGQPDRADKILAKVVADHPTNIDALRRLVSLRLRSGKRDQAIAAIENAVAEDQNNPGTAAALVDLYLQIGEKDKALALAQTGANDNDVRNAPLILARAHAELAAGRTKDAVASYRRLVTIDPASLPLKHELARAMFSSGDTAGARKVIEAALVPSAPSPQLAADLFTIDLKTSGIDAALATAKRLQHDLPSLATGPALVGDVYMTAKRYGDASAAYKTAFQVDPTALLVLRLAAAESAAKKPDEAAALLRKWLAKHPDDIQAASLLASEDLAAGRYDKARPEWEAIAAKRPMDAIALNNLAWIYRKQGDPRALQVAERAYLVAPGLGQTADTLGWILLKGGNQNAAMNLLHQASTALPGDPTVRYHLAVALKDTGHRHEAAQLLTPILAAGAPSFGDKPAAEKLLSELSPH